MKLNKSFLLKDIHVFYDSTKFFLLKTNCIFQKDNKICLK